MFADDWDRLKGEIKKERKKERKGYLLYCLYQFKSLEVRVLTISHESWENNENWKVATTTKNCYKKIIQGLV